MLKLEMQNITLGYGHRAVVEDITFDAKPGEMIGLVGPNGSGKTTIIKALCRVITPWRGKVLVNGSDIAGIPRRDLACLISAVPQMPMLPSAYTAYEVVLMGRNPHLGLFQYESAEDMAIAWQAMERTSSQHLAQRRISELSGGEIQGVIIARALAQETQAMLLDEPTANLDVGRQIEILDLIRELCWEKGLTVVAALHDLNLAVHYCDRVILISSGGIYAKGTPKQVITAENIEQVYGSGSYVHTHPLSGLPAVLPRVGGSRNSNYRKGKKGA